MTGILSVRQVTDRIKLLLEKQFPYVWVRGEVTNLTRPGSGHVYFSLKDGDAVLSCVWFRGRQRGQENVDPLTGEVFEDGPRPSLAQTMRNGQSLACAGQLSVYPPRGGYQLIVDLAQDSGEGLLYQAFERLKQTLAAEGLFAASRKRTLPTLPLRVALVTSPTGAAVRDFLRIAAERGVGAQIRIYPALVQGEEAPRQLIAAVRRAGEDLWPDGRRADVLVLVRGGGSLEDLWAFNDADLARVLSQSPIPTLTGVGHEIDTTIADLVADVRAATPSHAAQLLWQERDAYAQRVDDLEQGVLTGFQRALARSEERLAGYERALTWFSPIKVLQRLEERRAMLAARLARSFAFARQLRVGQLEALEKRLTLGGGANLTAAADHRLTGLAWRLDTAGRVMLEQAARRSEQVQAALERLDPEAPLRRGYALARDGQGRFIRSVHDVTPGDPAEIVLHDGSLSTVVQAVAQK